MSNIETNLIEIRKELDNISKEIEIVAATKTRSIEEIKECINTGLVNVAGENKVQEFTSKYDESIVWDYIGSLQTNKVKYLVGKVRLIQSVDRIELAEKINNECIKKNVKQKILIEVNSGKEEQKSGVFLEDIDSIIDQFSKLDRLEICGLMAVAPIADKDTLEPLFTSVYEKFIKLKNNTFKYLSMGMTDDYLIAAKCGSNMVRIGRKIFGERNYNI
ncbi:MAG: YggS family pyridoxal phosphate-dependent enzyme [Clostridia bacterium]|nr:YggS family pyridoxal phosphate-dependent enzyme [Clostridia bacterium]